MQNSSPPLSISLSPSLLDISFIQPTPHTHPPPAHTRLVVLLVSLYLQLDHFAESIKFRNAASYRLSLQHSQTPTTVSTIRCTHTSHTRARRYACAAHKRKTRAKKKKKKKNCHMPTMARHSNRRIRMGRGQGPRMGQGQCGVRRARWRPHVNDPSARRSASAAYIESNRFGCNCLQQRVAAGRLVQKMDHKEEENVIRC